MVSNGMNDTRILQEAYEAMINPPKIQGVPIAVGTMINMGFGVKIPGVDRGIVVEIDPRDRVAVLHEPGAGGDSVKKAEYRGPARTLGDVDPDYGVLVGIEDATLLFHELGSDQFTVPLD
jgi:hypothetical protein